MQQTGEIPIFILKGVDTINEFVRSLSLDFALNAETVRRIKLGEESNSDREMVEMIVVEYMKQKDCGSSISVKNSTTQQLIVYICCVCLKKDIWIERALKQSILHLAQQFPSLLCPQAAICCASSFMNPPTLSVDREFSEEYLQAVVCKYTRIKNKIKKLKELEKVHAKLIGGNIEILEKLDGKQFNIPHIHQNLVDGVEITSSISLVSNSVNNHSNTNATDNKHDQEPVTMLSQFTEFRNYEKTLECEKTYEELFWRWMLQSPSSSSSSSSDPKTVLDNSLLDPDQIKWNAQLSEMIKTMENEVLTNLFKEKIDLKKMKTVLQSLMTSESSQNTSNGEASLETSVDYSFQHFHNYFCYYMISNLLGFPDIPMENINQQLLGLRKENSEYFTTLMEVCNDSSPFHCAQKETTNTF